MSLFIEVKMQFTKEELELLEQALQESLSNGTHWRPDKKISLMLKIQPMIEDYCEHDGEIGKDYPAEKCMKCGAYGNE